MVKNSSGLNLQPAQINRDATAPVSLIHQQDGWMKEGKEGWKKQGRDKVWAVHEGRMEGIN